MIIIIWSSPLSDVIRVTASKQFALPTLDSKNVLVFDNYLDIFLNCILLSLLLFLCIIIIDFFKFYLCNIPLTKFVSSFLKTSWISLWSRLGRVNAIFC